MRWVDGPDSTIVALGTCNTDSYLLVILHSKFYICEHFTISVKEMLKEGA